MLRVGVIVLGVIDKDRARAFWTEALGYQPVEGGYGGWWDVLAAPDGSGARLALQMSETTPELHPRIHLDLHVDDAAEALREVERLTGLGAALVDWDSYPDDPDFVVLADPEGNRFCIVNLGHPD